MPLWIIFWAVLTLALQSQPAPAPKPEPAEMILAQPVFRAETGLPPMPYYCPDSELLAWAENYEATIGTPVVIYDLYAVMEGVEQLEAWVSAFEAGKPAELLLLGTDHGLSGGRYTFLLYDGGDSYTCLDAYSGEAVTGTAVWENRLGWEVAGAVPLLREIPDMQSSAIEAVPCDLAIWDHLLELDPESPHRDSVLQEAIVYSGTINGLPCQEYVLSFDCTSICYLETLDGSLLLRSNGIHWNHVILDQEAVLRRPGQEPESTPHCPNFTKPPC